MLTAPEQAAPASTLHMIGDRLHNKPEPEWDEALKNYRGALALRTAPEQAADRASTLHQIGYCLHNKPEPEWDEALKNYRVGIGIAHRSRAGG